MSQGHRQRLRKARAMAEYHRLEQSEREIYAKRDATIKVNRSRTVPDEEKVHVRTNISSIVCGIHGKGQSEVKADWGFAPKSSKAEKPRFVDDNGRPWGPIMKPPKKR